MLKKLAVSVINLYRNFLSFNKLPCCRFYPSCSAYAAEAIETKGFFKGLFLSLFRILRCNPFFRGGYDPVIPDREKNSLSWRDSSGLTPTVILNENTRSDDGVRRGRIL
jgi:uncharacterized protein